MTKKPRCKDCIAEGVTTVRPTPHPGPRCTTHHRAEKRSRTKGSHDKYVQKTYGLEPGQYAELYAAQGGKCAICQRATGATRRLAVDHCHATGEVRGLLCKFDNRLLGIARDDPAFFLRAAAYLVAPPAREVLRPGD